MYGVCVCIFVYVCGVFVSVFACIGVWCMCVCIFVYVCGVFVSVLACICVWGVCVDPYNEGGIFFKRVGALL